MGYVLCKSPNIDSAKKVTKQWLMSFNFSFSSLFLLMKRWLYIWTMNPERKLQRDMNKERATSANCV